MKLILTASCVIQIIDKLVLAVSCFGFFYFPFFKENPSGSSKIASYGRSIFLCDTLLFSPSWVFLAALLTPSFHFLFGPQSYKCHFPNKTSASLCLHALYSFSLKLYHLYEVVLNMYLCLFCSHPLLLILMASPLLDRYWSYDVTFSTFRL